MLAVILYYFIFSIKHDHQENIDYTHISTYICILYGNILALFWFLTEQEYTSTVDNHVKLMMEYQGKHKEACAKFESIEEEHLAQMITFSIQLASVLEANVSNVDKVRVPFQCGY